MSLYAIGDVQGCARAFDALLCAIEFDANKDCLWLAGDLVNRGPESLQVLRAVRALGDRAIAVLGNHDLHLLAAAAGVRPPNPADTFADILEASDAAALIDWLRHRPLLHHDVDARRLLVHAGIPPGWSVEQAACAAHEVESVLRSDVWQQTLASMYGDEPRHWRAELSDVDRMRYTINALTRMRFCDRAGGLDFEESGPPGSQPADLLPWFDHPGRVDADVHVVFGHWAALGVLRRVDVTATDSGCVWGGALTAIPLTPPGEPIAVRCAAAR